MADPALPQNIPKAPMAEPLQPHSSLDITQEVLGRSKIHSNVSQEFIVTTEDKVDLCLRDYQEELRSQRDWIAPTGILLSLLAALVAADFHNFLNIPGTSWQILFIAGLVATSVWFVTACIKAYKYYGKGTIKSIIEKLKQAP